MKSTSLEKKHTNQGVKVKGFYIILLMTSQRNNSN